MVIRHAEEQAKHADLAAFLEARGEQLRRSGSELEWADYHVTIRAINSMTSTRAVAVRRLTLSRNISVPAFKMPYRCFWGRT